MHGEYTQVPFSSHTHYCTSVHSLLQLICILFCSQGNNKNHREREKNRVSQILTASLRCLKSFIPSKIHFSYSVRFSGQAIRSGITSQDCISFMCVTKAPGTFSIITRVLSLPLFCTLLSFFGSSQRTRTGCKTAAQSEFFPYKKRHPL